MRFFIAGITTLLLCSQGKAALFDNTAMTGNMLTQYSESNASIYEFAIRLKVEATEPLKSITAPIGSQSVPTDPPTIWNVGDPVNDPLIGLGARVYADFDGRPGDQLWKSSLATYSPTMNGGISKTDVTFSSSNNLTFSGDYIFVSLTIVGVNPGRYPIVEDGVSESSYVGAAGPMLSELSGPSFDSTLWFRPEQSGSWIAIPSFQAIAVKVNSDPIYVPEVGTASMALFVISICLARRGRRR